MSWLTIISAVIQLAARLVAFAQARQQLQAGEAQAIADSLKESHAHIEKARAARRGADTGGVPDDDPYRRD